MPSLKELSLFIRESGLPGSKDGFFTRQIRDKDTRRQDCLAGDRTALLLCGMTSETSLNVVPACGLKNRMPVGFLLVLSREGQDSVNMGG